MVQGYSFNQDLKRLEPIDKKCGFCDKGKMQNVNDCHFASVFQEKNRTNILVYKSVKYSALQIGVPRCPTCLEIHGMSNKKASKITGFLNIGIVMAILLFAYEMLDFDIVNISLGILASLITILIIRVSGTLFLENILIRKQGVRTLNEGTNSNETIQDFVINGWLLSPPRP